MFFESLQMTIKVTSAGKELIPSFAKPIQKTNRTRYPTSKYHSFRWADQPMKASPNTSPPPKKSISSLKLYRLPGV